jgi:short-subunit dehydrogenase
MMRRRDGHIFNLCSIASIMAYPNGGSYSISKFALYGMTKVLRAELKDYGIRVTAVLPGATLTASWEGTDLPPDRFMRPEDVAEAIFAAHAVSKQTVIEELLLRPQLGDL